MGGPGGRPRWEAEGVVPYLKSDFGDFGRLTYQVGKAKIKSPKRRGNGKCILGPIGVKVFTRLNENEIETNYQAQEAACPLNIRSLS